MQALPNAPEIIQFQGKKIAGICLCMTLSPQKTYELWSTFMPMVNQIPNRVSTNLYSVQIYNPHLQFRDFGPDTEFEKWAAVEVNDFSEIPEHFQTMEIPEGLYAVFLHRGPTSAAGAMFRYIFEHWIPASEFEFEHRPQFEVMDHRYKHNQPDSEEEFWIPVACKK